MPALPHGPLLLVRGWPFWQLSPAFPITGLHVPTSPDTYCVPTPPLLPLSSLPPSLYPLSSFLSPSPADGMFLLSHSRLGFATELNCCSHPHITLAYPSQTHVNIRIYLLSPTYNPGIALTDPCQDQEINCRCQFSPSTMWSWSSNSGCQV